MFLWSVEVSFPHPKYYTHLCKRIDNKLNENYNNNCVISCSNKSDSVSDNISNNNNNEINNDDNTKNNNIVVYDSDDDIIANNINYSNNNNSNNNIINEIEIDKSVEIVIVKIPEPLYYDEFRKLEEFEFENKKT